MFYDDKNVSKHADKVFKYENFLTKEEVQTINDLVKKMTKEDDWVYEDQHLDWYKDKTGPNMVELFPIWEKMSRFLQPEYVIHPMMSLLTIKPGDKGMFVHADSPGRDMEEHLTQHDRWQTCCIIDYGIIVYFGEFTGGEVFYPNLTSDSTFGNTVRQEENYDDCLVVPVQPGDLVVHGSCHPYEHGVREVHSGRRYAFTNFMLQAAENPGTFHNFETPEYFEATKEKTEDYLRANWLQPIEGNPRFPQWINN